MAPEPGSLPTRRITLVADELLGYVRTGGLGTATTFLGLALARMGHDVEVLYLGPQDTATIDREWTRIYESAPVRIRGLPCVETSIEPPYFARMRDVELALAADPPDVVITQDLAAPAYTALRRRQLGLGFKRTLFVAYCHGTRGWITDTARKVRVLPGALAITCLEQASIELADVVVSPSAYLLEWMRGQEWQLPPDARVIPYVTRSAATGEPPVRARVGAEGVTRIVFFGRLEERKGLRPFAAGLNALGSKLLAGLELAFVGRATPAWPPERIEGLLSESVRQAVSRISFHTDLDQPEALAQLGRPGTLTVMPSLGETFSNAVWECLQHGLPFLSSDAGAPPELIAPSDRQRVLFPPTPEGVAEALRRALTQPGALQPARPAFDDTVALRGWAEVAGVQASRRPAPSEQPAVDVIVVHHGSKEALSRCLSALKRQGYHNVEVIVAVAGAARRDVAVTEGFDLASIVRSQATDVATAREAGLRAGSAPWVVFLDEADLPADEFLDTLARAQAASGADVVSCGLRLIDSQGERVHLFPGEPGGLGLLTNGYGTVALLRRSLLSDMETPWPVEGDPDWPLLARLTASGARVVSVPAALVTRTASPGSLERHPSDALLVAQQLERALPDHLRPLARLAAGLVAELQHASSPTGSRVPRRVLRPLAAIRNRR